MDGMTTGQEVVLYLITFAIFTLIQGVWLGIVARDSYRKALKGRLPNTFNPVRISTFIAIYTLGLLVLVLVPAVNGESLGIAMFRGTAFGFFTFSTYGLSNWVMLSNWPTKFTFQNIAWGTFLGFAVSTLAYNVYAAFYF